MKKEEYCWYYPIWSDIIRHMNEEYQDQDQEWWKKQEEEAQQHEEDSST